MLTKLLKMFEDNLFVEYKCVLCGRELSDTTLGLCPSCLKELQHIDGKICRKCGMPIDGLGNLCSSCEHTPYVFDLARAPLVFDELSSKLVYGLKYGNKKYLAKYLARLMLKSYIEANHTCDVIIPIPLCEKRIKQRKYNQSELIANELAILTNLLVDTSSIMRVKETNTQTQYTRTEREENLKNAFSCTNKRKLKGKSVLLIDDVFTTGATTNECARVLYKAGAKFIFVLTALKTKLE